MDWNRHNHTTIIKSVWSGLIWYCLRYLHLEILKEMESLDNRLYAIEDKLRDRRKINQ